MSTHCVKMIKNSNLSLKIKEEEEEAIVSILDNVDSTSSNGEEDHHEQLIKDQPTKTFDWSSILSSSKNEDSSNMLIPTSPYVHPLDKRSISSLSEKSLEICTESLGSETGSGSDCFPSSPTSMYEDSDADKDNHHHHHHQQQYSVVSKSSEDFHVYNHSKISISSCRSFPPSLPSIHMQSRRQNGRLILEAAFVPPKNSLHAQRIDGHLLLTFINQNDSNLEMEKSCEDEVEEFEQLFDDIQEEEDESTMMEQSTRLSSKMTNVNKASMMIIEQKNQLTWSKCTISFSMTSDYLYFNSTYINSINLMTEEEKNTSNIRECYTYPSSVSQPLPPPRDVAEVILAPPLMAKTSLNAYEYFWRKKPTVGNIVNNSTITKYYYNNKQVGLAPLANGTHTKATSITKIATCTQELVLIREKKASTMNNNLVPFLRSCKEPRRSLVIWEPYCIATS
ncbi:protein FAF-like, chloroplastic [Solanum dulcamara]|uniref:protein FAF-like, chloroplastic n=1 Tax=Solanum dulcamara TaxID=45834 RepID=UPI002485BD4D|nr:protein FAF-like, chloroplastic [Solanum dulcamara]